MDGEDAHRVVVGVGLDRVVHPHVALGLLAGPGDELFDGAAAGGLERTRLGEEELDAAPAITGTRVGERELMEVAHVDDAPHHLADRQPVALAMEVAKEAQARRHRMARFDERVVDRRVRPLAVVASVQVARSTSEQARPGDRSAATLRPGRSDR